MSSSFACLGVIADVELAASCYFFCFFFLFVRSQNSYFAASAASTQEVGFSVARTYIYGSVFGAESLFTVRATT